MPDPSTALTMPGIRRIVTTHDEKGHAVVQSDSFISPVGSDAPGTEGILSAPIWVTNDSIPGPTNDNNSNEDGALRHIEGLGLVEKGGANVRYTDLAPGVVTPMHRTDSIDFNILIHGSLVLITDSGSETLVSSPGDTVVQKGTIHAWRNPGTSWARWVTVLLAARPAKVNGKALEPVWHPIKEEEN